jgi:hypothetical protein
MNFLSLPKRLFRLILWTNRNGLINLYYRSLNGKSFEIQVNDEYPVAFSSITDSELFASFPSLCGSAANDVEIFKKFRSSKVMIQALDHVSFDLGKAYIDEILKFRPWSYNFTSVIEHIDSVGRPSKFKFSPFGTFSPTLLRYLKVYVDLEKCFGSLKYLNIAEIGVGFGGQGSLIGLIETPLSYTYFDIPPVLELARKFTRELEIPGTFSFMDGRNPNPLNTDLVISNYAFSELNRSVQDQYLTKVILPAPRGYITWNSLSATCLGGYSLAELIRIIPNSQILPEIPNTGDHNAIIVWGI